MFASPPDACAPRPALILMRHGFSCANEQRIIVSQMAHGVLDTYGLNDTGRSQVMASAVKLLDRLQDLQPAVVRVVTSPFSRTVQTAPVEKNVIIFVSHGDTLQITQSGLSGLPVHRHREMQHMNQSEWRFVS